MTIESLQTSNAQENVAQSAQRLTGKVVQSIQNSERDAVTISISFNDISIEIQGDYPLSLNADNLNTKELNITTDTRGANRKLTNIQDFNENLTYNLLAIAELFLPEFPDKSVTNNDSWTTVYEMPVQMPKLTMTLHFTTNYTVTGFENIMDYECMVFRGESDVVVSGKSTFQGLNIAMTGSGTGFSSYSFAYKEGHLMTGHREVVLAINGQVGGMDINIPIQQRLASEFKALE